MAKRSKRVAVRKSTAKRGKAVRKKAAKRAAAKKTNKLAKKTGKKLSTKARHSPIVTKARKKKRNPTPTLVTPVETTIIDSIPEPTPGVLVVSEIEATHITLPDSDEANHDQEFTPRLERPAA